MTLETAPVWPSIILAIAIFSDALMSIRPLNFVRACLSGIKFPENWWWVLIYIKLIAVAGLVAGIWFPGVGIAANIGVIAYFVAACIAHIKAKFLKSEFKINCLGMLFLSIASLILTILL